MIEDIQDLAKFNNGQKFTLKNQNFNVREFLFEVTTLFSEQCKFKDIELRETISDKIPKTLFSDPKRIKQCLMNLISNALKFTCDGFISISIDLENDVPISQRRNSIVKSFKFESSGRGKEKMVEKSVSMKVMKKIKIVIEDSGLGIQKKDLEKLFRHFGKLKDESKLNEKGCGLGLMICKRIVETMGGEITVESTFGKGTKFTMYIMVQVNENPIYQENESEIEPSISMEKIKSSMMALGNNLISGGLLGNGSMHFDKIDSRK